MISTTLSSHGAHIVQWIDYWALFNFIGLLACRAWLIPEHLAAAQTSLRHWHRALAFSLAVMTLACVALLVARTAVMSAQSFSSAIVLVPSVLLETYPGKVWVLRLLALSLIWLCWMRSATFDGFNRSRWFMLGSVCALALSYGAMSHAAAREDAVFGIVIQSVHLLFGAAWSGGIFVFVGVVLPSLMRSGSDTREKIIVALRRLSGLALVGMSGVIVTGAMNAWRMLGSISALQDSAYGRLLALKILLMLVLMVIGAVCRYRILPSLMRTDAMSTLTFKAEVSWLRRVLGVDRVVMLVLLFVVADLVHQLPSSSTDNASVRSIDESAICRSGDR